MKRILLSLILLLSGATAFAQLPNGSTAPDFTATDINGNTYHLADILASGKTVIMDISATWCHPCWNYHNTHYLDDIYNAYGPNASDEVVVLFVEGDPTTGMDDLYGQTAETQGNWVAGSEYPVIDNATIANQYQITYFPTIYRICPDGIVTEIGQQAPAAMRNGINSNCGATLVGTQNNAQASALDQRFCVANNQVIKARMRNLGSNSITAATLELRENGVTVATKNFTGNLGQFSTSTQSFPAINVNPDAVYTAEIVNVNTAAPFNPDFIDTAVPVAVAQYANTDVEVHVHTDNYPTEASWQILNSSNAVVASGGPYQGNANGGGAQANAEIIENVTLDANDCYQVKLLDSYGDGWTYGPTQHGIEIFSNGTSVFSTDAVFTTSLSVPAAVTTVALGVAEQAQKTYSISPNPSTGVFMFRTEQTASVEVFDITGKKVFQAGSITDNGVINLSNLQKGMYFAKVKTASGESVEKLILQ